MLDVSFPLVYLKKKLTHLITYTYIYVNLMLYFYTEFMKLNESKILLNHSPAELKFACLCKQCRSRLFGF